MSVEGSVCEPANFSTSVEKSTPNATCFEQFNPSSEEFLSMLRFDQRGKFEELQEKIDRTGQDDR
jgi:hypothetical protein